MKRLGPKKRYKSSSLFFIFVCDCGYLWHCVSAAASRIKTGPRCIGVDSFGGGSREPCNVLLVLVFVLPTLVFHLWQQLAAVAVLCSML